jgi:hypothetical protein
VIPDLYVQSEKGASKKERSELVHDVPMKEETNERTDLHTTNSSTKSTAGRTLTLLPLTLLLGMRSVHPILSRSHLQIQNARMLQPARQILHENKMRLTRDQMVLICCH